MKTEKNSDQGGIRNQDICCSTVRELYKARAQSVEQRWSKSEGCGFENLALVRVFVCPHVSPFPFLGLTLRWNDLGINLALQLMLYNYLDYYTKKASLMCKIHVIVSKIFDQPFENAIPRKTPNKLIAITSSKDEAAMTRVGIPCFTPNPFACNVRSWGTTTAGVTAPRTKLKWESMKAKHDPLRTSFNFSLSWNWDNKIWY